MAGHNGSRSKLPSVPNGKGTGRPTIYTEELANEICARLSEGQSLTMMCREDDMPCERVVMRWLFDETAKKSGFLQMYAQAREAQAEFLADQIIPIADGEDGPDSTQEDSSTAINRARLRVDARKHVAAIFNPERFSDKRQGGSTPGVVHVNINLGPEPKVIEHEESGNSEAPTSLPEEP